MEYEDDTTPLYVYTNLNSPDVPNLGWMSSSDEGSLSCYSGEDGELSTSSDYYFNQPNYVTPPRGCGKSVNTPSTSPRTIIEPIYEESPSELEDSSADVEVKEETQVVAAQAGWACWDEMMSHVVQLFYGEVEKNPNSTPSNTDAATDVDAATEVPTREPVGVEVSLEQASVMQQSTCTWMERMCGNYTPETLVESVVKKVPLNRSAQPMKQRVAYLTDLHREFYNSMDTMDIPRRRSRSVGGSKSFGQSDEDGLYYDSDPESYLFSSEDGCPGEHHSTLVSQHATITVVDDDECLEFIKETTHCNMRMKLHAPNKSSINVIAWIEQGSRISGQIIQPRLVWRKPSHLKSSIHNLSGNTLRQQELSSIELLDIYRILKATDEIKIEHPLAKTNNCLVVTTTNNGSYVFEAQSEIDRDRIIDGLKLLVSRLASMIIVGNNDVFNEFFNPRGSVPGAAPSLWNTSPPPSPVKTRDTLIVESACETVSDDISSV